MNSTVRWIEISDSLPLEGSQFVGYSADGQAFKAHENWLYRTPEGEVKPKRVCKSLSDRKRKASSDLLDTIKAHRKGFKPSDYLILEAAILRICDKLDRYNKGKPDAKTKCMKNMDKMKSRFQEQGFRKEWKEFEKIFQKMHSKISSEAKPL